MMKAAATATPNPGGLDTKAKGNQVSANNQLAVIMRCPILNLLESGATISAPTILPIPPHARIRPVANLDACCS
jgi:hypothetical protein